MSCKYPNSRILVFAREPVLGQVKTRLQAAIGQEQALLLYKAMLGRIAGTLNTSNLSNWDLYVSSNPSHELFTSICNIKNIYPQVEGDLGQKMSAAIAQTAVQAELESVIIIGSDCPAMSPAYLDSAITALDDGCDVVLGPAEDGGYVLLGLRRTIPELFVEIPWGSSEVLNLTLLRLQELGLSYRLLETLWDVDRPEDLGRLEELDPPLNWLASATIRRD